MSNKGIMALTCRIDDAEVNTIINEFERYSVTAQGRINDAIRKGVRTIARNARRRVKLGKNSKHLKSSIKTKVKKGKFGRSATGETFTAARHAHLIEFGVKAHDLRAKRRAVMRVDANGILRYVSGSVRHPGFGERPFLRPSFQEYKETFIRDIKEAIRN